MEQNTNKDNSININVSGSNHKFGDIKQTMYTIPVNNLEESTPLPKQIKDRINDLIANNYLEEAIDILDAHTTNSQTKNMCISVKQRLTKIKQDLIAGILSPAESNQQRQLITDSILKLKDMEL